MILSLQVDNDALQFLTFYTHDVYPFMITFDFFAA